MTRAGFVALLGAPNAGKSTLLNRLVGHRLAAITPKPQTTRFSLPAILTREEAQYIFVDTPGWIAEPRTPWHRALNLQSLQAAKDSDVQVWVYSAFRNDPAPEEVDAQLREAPALLLAITHLDRYTPTERPIQKARIESELQAYPLRACIDASIDQPLEPLHEALRPLLPEGPFLYPPDQLTPLPTRFFVAELLREALYYHLREEVPYGTELEIEAFKEQPEKVHISATIYVEKDSHKPILIGKGGEKIKKIRLQAQKAISEFLERPTSLELYVKVAPNWRRSPSALRRMGYKTA